jgi:hypothetical protein
LKRIDEPFFGTGALENMNAAHINSSTASFMAKLFLQKLQRVGSHYQLISLLIALE